MATKEQKQDLTSMLSLPGANDALASYRSLLNEHDPLPLYYQIAAILKHIVENGNLKIGSSFFSEGEVSEQLGVSRPTVNKAIQLLVEEGYLFRQRGKRAGVGKPRDVPLVFMEELLSFGEMIQRVGVRYRTVLLERGLQEPTPPVLKAFGRDVTIPVVRLKRLRFIEDDPAIVVDSYLPADRFGFLLKIPREDFAKDLYKMIYDETGIVVVRSERDVRAASMPPEDAKLLNSAVWEACLRLRGIGFAEDESVVEFFDSRLKGSRCILRSSVQRRTLADHETHS